MGVEGEGVACNPGGLSVDLAPRTPEPKKGREERGWWLDWLWKGLGLLDHCRWKRFNLDFLWAVRSGKAVGAMLKTWEPVA